MNEILKHADGTPKCVTSDYGHQRTWHYVIKEDVRFKGRHLTICDRLISGSVVGDRYAPDYGPNAGQLLPICYFCTKRRKKLETQK